ncbi:TPA: helix-turn-helix transcriptional regulator [Escherichia coli]|nr:helix-turn-helix transcriptional regulator [Escherichia coli]
MMRYREFKIIQELKRRILLSLKTRTKIPLKEISLMSGFSIKHTQELFFRQSGITIGKYIKQCLFSKAIIYLVLTRKNILDISLDAGFSSQQSFSRAFKKEFLLSPIKYRKRGIIDSQKIISEFRQGENFIYDGALYLPATILKSTFMRFTDDISTTGSIIMKHKRLLKIKSSLLKTDRILIVSFISPAKDETIKIDSFFCSSVETGEEISIANGMYYKIKFNGSLRDYIDMGRNIVLYINIPFPLDVVEEIKKDDTKVSINIYIPKRE